MEIIGNEVMIILEHPVENIVEIRDRNFYYPLQRKRAYTKFIEPTTARIYITKKGYIPKPLNRKYLKMRRANIKDLLNTWEHIWQSATTEYEVFLTYKDKVKNKVELMDAGLIGFIIKQEGGNSYADIMEITKQRLKAMTDYMEILQILIVAKLTYSKQNDNLTDEEARKIDGQLWKYKRPPILLLDIY